MASARAASLAIFRNLLEFSVLDQTRQLSPYKVVDDRI